MGRIVALVDGNFIGIFLKERGLVQAFGQRYRQHRRREDAAASAESIR